MTREELLEDIESPEPEPEAFEIAPGKTLLIRAPSDYATVEKFARQGRAVMVQARADPIEVRGKTVAVTEAALAKAAIVAASLVEPALSMRDVLRMSGRYGLRYLNLWGRCMELAGAAGEAEEAAVEEALDADPTTRDD